MERAESGAAEPCMSHGFVWSSGWPPQPMVAGDSDGEGWDAARGGRMRDDAAHGMEACRGVTSQEEIWRRFDLNHGQAYIAYIGMAPWRGGMEEGWGSAGPDRAWSVLSCSDRPEYGPDGVERNTLERGLGGGPARIRP